jgi:peptidyl-prolyl cis-trans isomerase SurA
MKRAVVLSAAVALLVAGAAARVGAQGRVIQRIIVKVNGEILTETDLEQLQILALRDKNKQVEKPADLQNDATLRALLAEVTPDILVKAVDELLMVQRGRELGFHLTDDQFKNALEGIKKENKLDDAGLKIALAQDGLTLDSLRQNLEHQYLYRGAQETDILSHVTLTESEERQYYEAHPKEFMKPETAVLREIFVAVPTQMQGNQQVFNVGLDDDAKQKIVATRDRILKGEDFAKVAGEVSDSASKANGGLIGTVSVSQLDPAVRDIIVKLKSGEVSEPLRTARGYQLFKLDSRTAEELQPFDAVRDLIVQHVSADRLDGETKKYLDKIRGQALIEWKVEDMKQMYEKRISEQKGR